MIKLFSDPVLRERNWKARGGNISLLPSLKEPRGEPLRWGKLDRPLPGFLERPITGMHPYVLLETFTVPVRTEGRISYATVVVAMGVRASGHREVLGADVTDEVSPAFWLELLRGLHLRGLDGVRLVTADDHAGLQLALRAVLPAAAWQRCLTHFVREAVDAAPISARPFAAAALRTVFAQPDRDTARQAIDRISRRLARRNPRLTDLLRRADPACLTYYSFPAEHRRQIWSTNAEGLLGDFARQCDLVGTFPSRRALVRMVTWVLRRQDAEWRAAGAFCKMAAELKPARGVMASPFRPMNLDMPARALVGATS
jgi:transposase-like protein